MKRKLALTALAALFCCSLGAQYMFDYSDIREGRFRQKDVSGIRSMTDGEHYTVLEEGRIDKYSYKTGQLVGTLLDNFPEEAGISDYRFTPDGRAILVESDPMGGYRHSYSARYWLYDLAGGTYTPLGEKYIRVPEFASADGYRLIYVYDNDLWIIDARTGEEKQLTTDGLANHIINGHTDWVYEEEFVFTRAFAVSPDYRQVAWLRFDETQVPEFSMGTYTGSLYPEAQVFKYPKAGEKNSVVTLHTIDLQTGTKQTIDTGAQTDIYIPHLGYTPEGVLYFYRLNRLQNHFEVFTCNDATPQLIYEERDRRYIERPDAGTLTFLPKGRFVVLSERSGYRHLYVHSIEKGVTDTLTRGNWEVTAMLGVEKDRVYYMSNETSVLRNNFYSVRTNGRGKTKLTEGDGIWNIEPAAGFRYFISRFSNVSTPRQVRVHDASGRTIRTLEDNAELTETLYARKVPRKEFFRFTTERGTPLHGYIIRPLDFDPSRKYPVMLTQYSGPGSQRVLDRWSMDWTDVLVQEGYIVVCVDGRGTGGRGAEFRKVTYGNLGGPETEDQISVAKYMATQSYVDFKRIGIFGWSYGGFMALNCILKGSDVFSMAIAVAPVTSWRYYDTIYTEVYNGLPQDNAYGYDNNSPVNFAGQLRGKLLIIHGTGDDNVHFQNTMAMADALVRADKDFDMMVYPDDNHSMKPTGGHHVFQKMISYTLANL